mmetsp:Transcript_6586/g.12126  ORF Transcript_6586/g.12126 Transcript_6586/m.12126 type:complete len:243 (-) Transcript_6586:1394-2122(-)
MSSATTSSLSSLSSSSLAACLSVMTLLFSATLLCMSRIMGCCLPSSKAPSTPLLMLDLFVFMFVMLLLLLLLLLLVCVELGCFSWSEWCLFFLGLLSRTAASLAAAASILAGSSLSFVAGGSRTQIPKAITNAVPPIIHAFQAFPLCSFLPSSHENSHSTPTSLRSSYTSSPSLCSCLFLVLVLCVFVVVLPSLFFVFGSWLWLRWPRSKYCGLFSLLDSMLCWPWLYMLLLCVCCIDRLLR